MRIGCKVLGVLSLVVIQASVAEWTPGEGPLRTRWTKEVSATNALPEYPRPQMVRKDWLNLNGVWRITLGDQAEQDILVPYPIESALSGVMKHVDRMTYRRRFEVPASWAGRRVLLHFGGVDWDAKVSVNGVAVGEHRGGYDAFSIDITKALKASGEQDVVVDVFDPTDKGSQPRGKQVLNPGGIMYTPASGIWQTVWLEPVSESPIESLLMVPDVDASCLRLTVQGEGTVEAVATFKGKTVAKVRGAAGEELVLNVRNPKLWAPGSPHLYDLRVTLKSGRKKTDEVSSYFGMRKIALGKDDAGVTRMMLNDAFVFQVGPLDQGFWPDGIYTAPTDDALRYDIEATLALGFNCTRKHVKVEPDRWYYWCDKLGLLVWQDMAAGDNRSAEDKAQFELELGRVITSLRNHPSIIMWVVFNEGWGQHDTERLTRSVKEMDPSRLVNNASGWTDKNCGDVIDMHNYPGPGSPKPEENRAAVLGEFGGLGLAVEDHTWTGKSWGYKGTRNSEDLTRSYEDLLRKAWALKDSAGLSACIYTQITDVETECNGLLTYDRAVYKVDVQRTAAANKGVFPPPPVVTDVLPSSKLEGHDWKYTTNAPTADWMMPGFEDDAWQVGPAGFGTEGTPGAVVRTAWRTTDIWLRRSFIASNDMKGDPGLIIHHDEDVEVYINGVLAFEGKGFLFGYEWVSMTTAGAAAIISGENQISVHCHQTNGGQYIDVGVVMTTHAPK